MEDQKIDIWINKPVAKYLRRINVVEEEIEELSGLPMRQGLSRGMSIEDGE